MSDPKNLEDVYVEELQDLWSANDQMKAAVTQFAEIVEDSDLKQMLQRSVSGIQKHTDVLKQLISAAGGEMKREHCRGMEGLVAEARKHAVEPKVDPDVRNVLVIAHYQRMSHYGIAGFGTAKAYAEALGETEAATRLDEALEEIYEADDFASELATRSKNLQAA